MYMRDAERCCNKKCCTGGLDFSAEKISSWFTTDGNHDAFNSGKWGVLNEFICRRQAVPRTGESFQESIYLRLQVLYSIIMTDLANRKNYVAEEFSAKISNNSVGAMAQLASGNVTLYPSSPV